MKLGKLYESFTFNNTDFLRLYQTENLLNCKNLHEIKETIQNIFNYADDYAINNKLQYKYFELAKTPLWENVTVSKQHFILKGFDAYICIDLTKPLKNITPYIEIQNNNIDTLKESKKCEINDEFLDSMVCLQKNIFLEALNKLENETISIFQQVWSIEKQRIDKWVKTTKVNSLLS